MTKYLINRILRSIVSVILVVGIVMIMIYSLLDRNLIFAKDGTYSKLASNAREIYTYRCWEDYGYLDLVNYTEYVQELANKGEIDEDTRAEAASFARKAENDSDVVKEYAEKFTKEYESKGYTVLRRDAVTMKKNKLVNGGQQTFFAYKNIPVIGRLGNYLKNLVTHDSINYVQEDIGERGLTFTWHDPVYGGEKFSPAILGNGTFHKYLLYCDNRFPFIHQNLFTINLGTSYSVNQGIDVFITMNSTQGSYTASTITYPTGVIEESADDLHTATYMPGSRETNPVNIAHFADDYTNVSTVKSNPSKIGFSFIIGIISVALDYLLGIPLGIVMARKKDGLVDKLGTIYVVFIIAVPSLAYIFLFKAIGNKLGLPITFDMESKSKLMYVLPIISLSLPSIAGLMKWLRRYMIDQMNADYVKFARSGGLSEKEIFSKHILKNAAIPVIHGIPGSVLGALVGAIITERVYVVPGAGNLLTKAINFYDNGVIVGVTLFYAVLSVLSLILGDILMSMVDPRISFTSKAR